MRKIAITISVLVFALGLGVFASVSRNNRPEPAKSFVVTYTVSRTEAGAKPVQEEIQTRFVKATGESKFTRYFLSNGTSLVKIATADSIYDVGQNTLNFVGARGPAERDEAFRSAVFHKSHPEFARIETIAGLTTYVHHAGDKNGFWVENYYAPETGMSPLKTVMHNADASELIIEAISVQFRNVSDDEVAPPDFPVSFEKANHK